MDKFLRFRECVVPIEHSNLVEIIGEVKRSACFPVLIFILMSTLFISEKISFYTFLTITVSNSSDR